MKEELLKLIESVSTLSDLVKNQGKEIEELKSELYLVKRQLNNVAYESNRALYASHRR